MKPLIELSNIEKVFSVEPPIKPLDSLNLIVHPGELVVITGVSGKGKSTLLSIMGGILRPTSGAIIFRGEDITEVSSKRIDELLKCGIGFIFQIPHLFQALTVEENLVFSQKSRGLRISSEKVFSILEEFGLQDRKDHLPSELSVGQKRRLVIAQALAANHELILADEPTNDLDSEWSDHVFTKLRRFVDNSGKAAVVVTHDESYVTFADTVYVLEKGKLHLRKKVIE